MAKYPVFGRDVDEDHPFLPSLERWLSPRSKHAVRAVGCNVLFDHRVSAEREAALKELLPTSGGRFRKEAPLEAALRNYQDALIRSNRRPAFLDKPSNRENFIPRRSGLELARLLDLNRLSEVFKRARLAGIASFFDFPQKPDDLSISKEYDRLVANWLGRALSPGSARREITLADIFQALERDHVERPFQPAWVTAWKAFEPYQLAGPACWAAILGLPNKWAGPRWLMVLRYRLPAGVQLVRPTIMDAGYEPYHFPSPRQAQVVDGGHPLDLRAPPCDLRLLPEFLHEQIPLKQEHWEAAGCLLGATVEPPAKYLAQRRRRHLDYLAEVYGKEVLNNIRRSI
jgi:hypothetical protein